MKKINFKKSSAVLTAAALAISSAAMMTACSSTPANNTNTNNTVQTKNNTNANANKNSSSNSNAANTNYVKSVDADDQYGHGIHHATLTVAGYDPITIELNADAAPVSVSNFCKLASSGYYDGLTFYRFVDGFCMQGGTKGNNASGQDSNISNIIGEFSKNGVDNPLADDFKKGTVAMARTTQPNSAGSTFFVTLGSGANVASSLNGQYAAFGTIDESGMKIVGQIVADYIGNASAASSGAIADESKQAKITSIAITD